MKKLLVILFVIKLVSLGIAYAKVEITQNFYVVLKG